MSQSNIIKYTISTQQQYTNSIQVPIDYKPKTESEIERVNQSK